MKIIFFLLLISVFFVTGCTMRSQSIQATSDLMASKNVYKECIKATPGNCSTEKELYNSDLKAMRVIRGDVVTIQK